MSFRYLSYRNEFKAAAVLVPDGHFCFGTTSGLSYSRREYGTGQEDCLGDELTRLLQLIRLADGFPALLRFGKKIVI